MTNSKHTDMHDVTTNQISSLAVQKEEKHVPASSCPVYRATKSTIIIH